MSSGIESDEDERELVDAAISQGIGTVSDEEGEGGEGEEEEDEEGAAELATPCLFSSVTAASPEEAVRVDAEQLGFSLSALRLRYHLDLYAMIRLVNLIRSSVGQSLCWLDGSQHLDRQALLEHMKAAGLLDTSTLQLPAELLARISDPANDELLRPVLPADPLLIYVSSLEDDADESSPSYPPLCHPEDSEAQSQLEHRILSLKETISSIYNLDELRSQQALLPSD